MTPAIGLLLAITGALVLYLLFGGADFGGGLWDALASGPRKERQRRLITEAIGPIWEANHVWLILALVLLFTGFPRAFAAASIAFHIPLTLLLIGIVFRGSAFTFRTLDTSEVSAQQVWGRMFSVASVVAPLLLGMLVGGLASGLVRVHDLTVTGGWVRPWTQPFALATGVLCLSLCAFLAATYLSHEAREPELANDFRVRAIGAGVCVFLAALAAFLLSAEWAPLVRAGLTRSPWTVALHLATAGCAIGAFAALLARRYAVARFFAAGQAALIVAGWAASQFPYLVVPDLTYENASADPDIQRLVLWFVVLGVPLLFPCLYLLFRIFKGERAFAVVDREGEPPRD